MDLNNFVYENYWKREDINFSLERFLYHFVSFDDDDDDRFFHLAILFFNIN